MCGVWCLILCKLNSGYKIPKGCFVELSRNCVAQDETLFANCNNFDPFRFDKCHCKGTDGVHPSKIDYHPFGIGTRMCIGWRLAEAECIILVSQLLANFTFQLTDDFVLKSRYDITYGPKESGIWIKYQ